jgi:high-affinity Fe2+/Pb2+ permease
MDGRLIAPFLFAAAGLAAGAGAGMRNAVKNFDAQVSTVNGKTTEGVFRGFYNLSALCAYMFVFGLFAIFSGLFWHSAAYALLGSAAALSVAALICAVFARKRGGLEMRAVDISVTRAIMSDIQSTQNEENILGDESALRALIERIQEEDGDGT